MLNPSGIVSIVFDLLALCEKDGAYCETNINICTSWSGGYEFINVNTTHTLKMPATLISFWKIKLFEF